jgi:hypothetical protein
LVEQSEQFDRHAERIKAKNDEKIRNHEMREARKVRKEIVIGVLVLILVS